MQRRVWLSRALVALGLAAYAGSGWSQQSWWNNWFKMPGSTAVTSPEPGVAWQPQSPLPPVTAPPVAPAPERGAAPVTLAELTEFALRNNPRARQAWAAARAAAAGVAVEEADFLPQLSGLVGLNRIRPVSGTTGAVSPWQTRYGPSVNLTYVLFDLARADQVRAAEYRLLAANLQQNRVLQDVVFQVEQAYFRLRGLELLVRVNELSLKNLRTSLDAANRRRESGLATVADVYRADTQVAQADVTLIRSRGEFEKARGQLASAVGLAVNQTLTLPPMGEIPEIKELMSSVDELLDRARASRPDLVAAEAQVRAARASADAASKANLPTLELNGVAGKTGFLNSASRDNPIATNYNIGLALRIPIFTGFRDRSLTAQAQALADQAEASRDVLYRQTELDVWQAYYDVKTAAGGISSTDAQVKSAEQTAQATLARYQAGFGSILDLITAQQDESNARVQRIQSYLDWYTAVARLQFSTGFGEVLAAASGKK
ncbi:MAG TPA: TolC family protein [Burkholderiales bacterium]|nr:TolC family protein [Burkholderiales bacterium]